MADPNDKYAFSHSESEGEEGVLNPEAEALLDRSTILLNEIESFQKSLRRANIERTVELRLFVNQVKSEHRCLQGLAIEPPDSTNSRHGVHASNLPYLEAVWMYAKSTTGITALCKTFSYTEPEPSGRRGNKKKKSNVTVDIVAQNGLQWIKVSLLTPRRLLFEIAKAGWEESAEFSDEDPEDRDAALATGSTSLSQLADNLLLAASQTRIQYLHPAITFVLPNLPPSTAEVRSFLTSLQEKGITISTPSGTLPATLGSLIDSISSPLARRALPLSNTLNIDTTILLALISDISHHASVPKEPRFHHAILRQLEMEAERGMIKDHLLPVLAGRKLFCSQSARDRFDEIVEIVATPTERARAELLFPPPSPAPAAPPRELAEKFQELSVHPVMEIFLPIETVPDHVATANDPPGFLRIAGKLSAVNRGAFITGWAHGVTTVTSNRAVAKMVEAACSGEGNEDVVGPDVYVVESARSLVGKAKRIIDDI
ncbi:hypothetical protein FN846DRAFT_907974 [Sphaerosporella brunnea]|uniref:DUF1308 domain-containing protein n=1 Tax=Sphaerosporella brunnea TaxID=1250544 RepID=A0A5J5EUA7_9PEZI|nr:hypothetical protein FN846DRAFT_907974 [Sphaerosporella brunnea]